MQELKTTGYKVFDFFISYSRSESLLQAATLHQQLQLADHSVWFDKVSMLHAEDYELQIQSGIHAAHVVVFLITPSSIRSSHCIKEYILALKAGKCIVPVLQVAPDIEDFEYIQQHYSSFLEKEDVEKAVAHIKKTDWIYGRQAVIDLSIYNDWKESYENSWKKHADSTYLKAWSVDIPMETKDGYQEVVRKLLSLRSKHAGWLLPHTTLLLKANIWEQGYKNRGLLLIGEEREEMLDWVEKLLEKKDNRVVEETPLQAAFLMESRKNGENLWTDVFIGYANNEVRKMRDLQQQLHLHLKSTWVDIDDIEKGKDYRQEIRRGIESADYFLMMLSPSSMKSPYCLEELEYARSLGKRIVPLLVQEVEKVSTLGFSERTCLKQSDKRYFEKLLRVLQLDQNYLTQHKQYLCHALRWERADHNPSMLLRGYQLKQALNWYRGGEQYKENPPIDLQKRFIEAGEQQKAYLDTEVFLSYSRKDADFARMLNVSLQESGKNTWFDQENIPAGSQNFWEEIQRGIDSANNFLFILSPDALSSPYCEDEVAYAMEQGKRILTVRYKALGDTPLPEALQHIQWVDFLETKDFATALGELSRALEVDRHHVESHSKWQQKALYWKSQEYNKDMLLSHTELILMQEWLEETEEEKYEPLPTALQLELFQASEELLLAKTRKEKRDRHILMGLLGAASISFLAAGAGFIYARKQYEFAEQERQLAIQAQQQANTEKEKALEAYRIAEEAKQQALQAAVQTRKLFDQAEYQKQRAEEQAKQAYWAKEKALASQRKTAQAMQALMLEREKAEQANEDASKAREEAELASRNAMVRQLLYLYKVALLEENDITRAVRMVEAAYFINKDNEEVQQAFQSFQPYILGHNVFRNNTLTLPKRIATLSINHSGDKTLALHADGTATLVHLERKEQQSFLMEGASIQAVQWLQEDQIAVSILEEEQKKVKVLADDGRLLQVFEEQFPLAKVGENWFLTDPQSGFVCYGPSGDKKYLTHGGEAVGIEVTEEGNVRTITTKGTKEWTAGGELIRFIPINDFRSLVNDKTDLLDLLSDDQEERRGTKSVLEVNQELNTLLKSLFGSKRIEQMQFSSNRQSVVLKVGEHILYQQKGKVAQRVELPVDSQFSLSEDGRLLYAWKGSKMEQYDLQRGVLSLAVTADSTFQEADSMAHVECTVEGKQVIDTHQEVQRSYPLNYKPIEASIYADNILKVKRSPLESYYYPISPKAVMELLEQNTAIEPVSIVEPLNR
ncbi:TIR domain-containing protein [Algivirga pacifica]|uniref:TIR domain-containing protein n=1 Tax=Algivirga pacifica TaxID=1162670 RepID=A0ABP9D6M0_9BACT